VLELLDETSRTRTIRLAAPDWAGHRAGQHVDIRLTAEDGYQAQRSYSIASAPDDGALELTVEELDDGEVSPYLTRELRAGDELELRGPVGGYFVWDQEHGGPLMLIGGGSGIVPLRAMLRHWSAFGGEIPVRMLYSSRSLADVIYRDELLDRDDAADVHVALTRDWPEDWSGHRGRVNRALLDEIVWAPEQRPRIYICGPTGFVEAMSSSLVEAGHATSQIRTERFGPTGS
jgi:ferredoxin-NADP reductase